VVKAAACADGKKLIGVNATAAFGPAKCWPAERFRRAALRLVEEDKDVTLSSLEICLLSLL